MFSEEAQWIQTALSAIINTSDKTAINFGSSTQYFRAQIQPHIDQYIFQPLEDHGWKIVHVDIKKEDGVDYIADLTDVKFSEQFGIKASLVICTNMLEHVTNIALAVNNLIAATKPGGYLLITVPYKYKKHLDPIDNMFRPTPPEIAALFSNTQVEIIKSAVIVINDKNYYRVKKSSFPLWGKRERVLYHLGKRYKVSGVLLKINP